MNPWRVIKSILAGFIGVQSKKDHLEDFNSNSPAAFIVAGIIMTLVFIGLIISVVNLVL